MANILTVPVKSFKFQENKDKKFEEGDIDKKKLFRAKRLAKQLLLKAQSKENTDEAKTKEDTDEAKTKENTDEAQTKENTDEAKTKENTDEAKTKENTDEIEKFQKMFDILLKLHKKVVVYCCVAEFIRLF